MKDEAARARQMRLAAAKRLLKNATPTLPAPAQPKKQKEKMRYMVPPVEVAVVTT